MGALSDLIKGLPADLPAAIFVVRHISAHSKNALPDILNRRGELSAVEPRDGERIRHGVIYVAPPDLHMLIRRGYIHFARGPRENRLRPAIDPLFRTAAVSYGSRVVGVVLSGTLDDGTAGLMAVKRRGGIAVVQDPDDALHSGMPRSAIENVEVDYILPASAMAPVLVKLAAEPVEEGVDQPVDDEMQQEADIAELDFAALRIGDKPGHPSRFSCPECQGVLWEIDDENIVRFRCRVGHAYSPETLLAEQGDQVEVAIWAGLRALEENAALISRMAKRMREKGNEKVATRFDERAGDAIRRAETLRQMILGGKSLTIPELGMTAPESERRA